MQWISKEFLFFMKNKLEEEGFNHWFNFQAMFLILLLLLLSMSSILNLKFYRIIIFSSTTFLDGMVFNICGSSVVFTIKSLPIWIGMFLKSFFIFFTLSISKNCFRLLAIYSWSSQKTCPISDRRVTGFLFPTKWSLGTFFSLGVNLTFLALFWSSFSLFFFFLFFNFILLFLSIISKIFLASRISLFLMVFNYLTYLLLSLSWGLINQCP